MPKFHVRKGDTVIAVAGKDKGKTGKVLRILLPKERVVVEGLNFIKKHTRPRPPEQQGGILRQEAAMHLSNVMVYCPRCSRASRVGRKQLEDGVRVRFCRRCGDMVGKK